MTAATIDLAKIDHILHVLRNPYGWNDHVVRDARLAATRLEQLAVELLVVEQERDAARQELAYFFSVVK
ncbi:MAG: hypothetical protein IPM06_21890 [Rhizobiales bacterium]|nr:hypothetical protein [Hyphomicrobiales bacterium]